MVKLRNKFRDFQLKKYTIIVWAEGQGAGETSPRLGGLRHDGGLANPKGSRGKNKNIFFRKWDNFFQKIP
ncbi:hypothetical protein FDUTEX481_08504 [Tolypothrix sp. PCC 7601]|nr:hypothetical protein FDUTEX481_08504 [Tolypothrix sp. PCC 7601]